MLLQNIIHEPICQTDSQHSNHKSEIRFWLKIATKASLYGERDQSINIAGGNRGKDVLCVERMRRSHKVIASYNPSW